MNGNVSKRRIRYALYLNGWSFEKGSPEKLKADALKIEPSEYQKNMEGNIFCPVCLTNLNRVPKDKDHFSNGREAYFGHLPTYTEIDCDLRSEKPEGKRYSSYEEAQKAIDDENLVIINGFITEKPQLPEEPRGEYDETPVEDQTGPVSSVPISRHNGESFRLPSKISTVAGICRKFDENLYKYFFFSNQRHAIRLLDLLHNVEDINDEDDSPKLYYGRIMSTTHLGENQRPDNIRMTYLKNNQSGVQDFCLKMKDMHQKSHGITNNSVRRILMVYGKVSESGTGLCFKGLGWGEFALLSQKYENLLP